MTIAASQLQIIATTITTTTITLEVMDPSKSQKVLQIIQFLTKTQEEHKNSSMSKKKIMTNEEKHKRKEQKIIQQIQSVSKTTKRKWEMAEKQLRDALRTAVDSTRGQSVSIPCYHQITVIVRRRKEVLLYKGKQLSRGKKNNNSNNSNKSMNKKNQKRIVLVAVVLFLTATMSLKAST